MANKALNAAKRAKKDEFYTRREDIERELSHYADHFRGKVVYCNCDDPEKSEFWQFFVRNFAAWGLRKIVTTHYEPDAANFAYKLEMTEENSGQPRMDGPERIPIASNGDFRSACCIELLEEADIVVTNPPFSLFREYVAQLMEFRKKFIIIGHQNAITYKEIFPLIRDNHIWLGYGFPGNIGFFHAPNYEDYAVSSQHKEGMIRVSGVVWFTNLDIPRRHTPLDLRGNYYYGHEDEYPAYENYDAINVDKVGDIPCDYSGFMGVPITFLDKYCPDQFEILMMANGNARTSTDPSILDEVSYRHHQADKGGLGIVHGERVYARIIIRRKR